MIWSSELTFNMLLKLDKSYLMNHDLSVVLGVALIIFCLISFLLFFFFFSSGSSYTSMRFERWKQRRPSSKFMLLFCFLVIRCSRGISTQVEDRKPWR